MLLPVLSRNSFVEGKRLPSRLAAAISLPMQAYQLFQWSWLEWPAARDGLLVGREICLVQLSNAKLLTASFVLFMPSFI